MVFDSGEDDTAANHPLIAREKSMKPPKTGRTSAGEYF